MYRGGMTKAVAAQTSYIPPMHIGFVANRGSVLSCVLSKNRFTLFRTHSGASASRSAPSATFQPSRWSRRSKSTWWQACATGASRHTLLKEEKRPRSSTAAILVSTTMVPTPGAVIASLTRLTDFTSLRTSFSKPFSSLNSASCTARRALMPRKERCNERRSLGAAICGDASCSVFLNLLCRSLETTRHI